MEKRNVILVTADSIRADYCGFLNSALDTTPNLTRMASDSLVYENAIAPGPRTPSSMPSIFTGELMTKPDQTLDDRSARIGKVKDHMERNTSIAQMFKENGYTTIGFTTNPWTTEATAFDAGFDRFEAISRTSYSDSFPFNTRLGKPIYNSSLGKAFEYFGDWWKSEGWFSQWPTFYDEVVDAVHAAEEPFFLWVFLLDSHNPYIVPRDDRVESTTVGMYHSVLRSNRLLTTDGLSSYKNDLSTSLEHGIKKAYRDSIRSVDRFVGDLHADSERYDPVFVFHSDHGEAFGEHGSYGHQSRLYSENLHVPLLIHNSGGRGRVESVVSLVELVDILRENLLEQEPSKPDEKRDEVSAISQGEQGDRVSVRDDRWKLVLKETETGRDYHLYDHAEDPRETRDVADEHPELVNAYAETLLNQIGEDYSVGVVEEVDDSLEDHLEALGYK